MGGAPKDMDQAARQADDDVVALLLEQHSMIREQFGTVSGSRGALKQKAFDELRALPCFRAAT